MSTNNICFCGEIRKIVCGYPLLSGAMCFVKRPGHKKTYVMLYVYTDDHDHPGQPCYWVRLEGLHLLILNIWIFQYKNCDQ